MIEPHVHVACTPRGALLRCAAFWLARGNHVYGWYTGARGREFPAAFFVLEDYYSKRDTAFYRSEHNDVFGAWCLVTAQSHVRIEAPGPVPPALAPELERLQDAFAREWLLYRDDAAHAAEADALRARDVPLRAVNLRPKKLDRLAAATPAWSYTTPGADLNVIEFLALRWTLDYAPR